MVHEPPLSSARDVRNRRVLVVATTALTVAAIVTVVGLHSSEKKAGGSVQRMSASPLGRRELQRAAWTGNKLLIWGGETSSTQTGAASSTNDGALYDPQKDSWQPAPEDPAPSAADSGSAVATVGSFVYTFGAKRRAGNGGYDRVSTRYDAASNSWTQLPAPPLCVTAATVVGASIDVTGFSCDSSEPWRTPVWATYDIAGGQWTVGAQRLPERFSVRQLLAWHGGLVAVDFFAQFRFLAPGAGQWTPLPPVADADITGSVDPGFAPPKVAVGVFDGRLVAVTRVASMEKLTHLYAWDDRAGTWAAPVNVPHNGPVDWHWAATPDRIAWITDGGLVWIDKALTPTFVPSAGVSSTDGGTPTLTFLGANAVAYWGDRVTNEPTNTGLLFHPR